MNKDYEKIVKIVDITTVVRNLMLYMVINGISKISYDDVTKNLLDTMPNIKDYEKELENALLFLVITKYIKIDNDYIYILINAKDAEEKLNEFNSKTQVLVKKELG